MRATLALHRGDLEVGGGGWGGGGEFAVYPCNLRGWKVGRVGWGGWVGDWEFDLYPCKRYAWFALDYTERWGGRIYSFLAPHIEPHSPPVVKQPPKHMKIAAIQPHSAYFPRPF